ncbi:hypothetical protein [Luteimonas suaedae]|uniref:hypothetical protein n=1 Tax=Luteimonas suaedae TaxID=2605430 RepID=UPI0011F035AF|nr:hypothetical protein [Luteimonas suaedae]
MNASDDPLSTQLHALAERWLKRPLTAAETRELMRFRQSSGHGAGETSPAAVQVEQTVQKARRQAQAAIQNVLDGARELAQRMAREREQEDRAILAMVESAGSLADLRPSALPDGAGQGPSADRIVIAQIADRLANMVRTEVQACFERQLAPLANRIEALLNEAHAPPSATPDAQDPSQNSSGAANP